jgi:putative DNA methylase
VKYKKKLIEVALPLEAINAASGKEKSIRQGHPSTLHLWWARRPLAAARAVIFSQMVDDPSSHPDIFKNEKAQDKERQRLFRIVEDLVKWENTSNTAVLNKAREEIWQSWRYTCAENANEPYADVLYDRFKLPKFHDPFAGGGAIPLEAQRLGLESYASDLNPVAVLLNKAMIEIPPKFTKCRPVNSQIMSNADLVDRDWIGLQGLSEDINYYGSYLKDLAEKKIGHLYPLIEITKNILDERPDLMKYAGQKLNVIACLWARTVNSPNPAFKASKVPLATTFMLSTKDGKEAYVEPIIEGDHYRFVVRPHKPPSSSTAKIGTKSGSSGSSFLCLLSGTPMPFEYLRAEAKAGRMGSRLMAIVVEGDRERIYLAPSEELERIALNATPIDIPEAELPAKALGFRVQEYGMLKWSDLFTNRQLVALTTFTDLIPKVKEKVLQDAIKAGLKDDERALEDGGNQAAAYADAISVYMACAIGKLADYNSTICSWISGGQTMRNTFGRQAIPMVWDYAEANVLSDSTGGFLSCINQVKRVVLEFPGNQFGYATQNDAQTQSISNHKVISTDPPYYDNIGYADLSDFFYVWMRRSLKNTLKGLFSTLNVPKSEELVATPFRHGSKLNAEKFFLSGMTEAMHRLAELAHPAFPVTIYYAFKQSEADGLDGTTNTGWDTFLAAVIEAGFSITGTWPMRTEMGNRMVSSGTNALASSIVLVCRKISSTAKVATRREFVADLKAELPNALRHLQAGNIAPVDLAQAAIGPGMAVYTKFSSVLDAEGKPLSVRSALALINQILDESLAEQEGDFDADSRFALAWFDQYGFSDGEFGVADVLARAKATSVAGVSDAGIIQSGKGKVRLFRPNELPADWDPLKDGRITAWEVVHQLVRVLEANGESAAAQLVAKLGSSAEIARELCYRLYTLCERKKRANDAMAYNSLVQSWPEITRLASESSAVSIPQQDDFFRK